MNLREFLFYFNINARELAEEFNLSHSYVRNVLTGTFPISPNFAEKVEKFTHGMVRKDRVDGPFTHPAYKKIMRDKNHPLTKLVNEKMHNNSTDKD